MVWLPEGKKCEDMFIRFDRMYERDRHTYRQTDRQRMTVKALRSQKISPAIKKARLLFDFGIIPKLL